MTVRLAPLDVSRLPWTAEETDRALAEYVAARLQVLAGAEPCPPAGPLRRLASAAAQIVFEWDVACPPEGALRIRGDLLYEVAPSHLHFAQVRQKGAPPLERVLSEGDREWALPDAGDPAACRAGGATVAGYVKIGIDHILSGPDHLSFIFALLLLGSSLGEVAKIVTGFTVAHSITLALTVLGYLRPDRAAIDALIGLSIAMVAIENLWLGGWRGWTVPALVGGGLAAQAAAAALGFGCVPAVTLTGLAVFSVCYFGLLARLNRAESLRWAIAFLFGLVHGFGFAGVLLEAQLSTDRLVRALFGFNAGVEVGQFALVLLVWPPLRRAALLANGRLHAWLLEAGSAAVLAIGLFWFVSRTYG